MDETLMDEALSPAQTELDLLPERSGARPRTSGGLPHEQLSQNAPARLQDDLLAGARELPGVELRPSQISRGSRAFTLPPDLRSDRRAFMRGGEFAHLHAPHDGSLHLFLPQDQADAVIAKGWGELHPLALRMGGPSRNVMVYGPRDEGELESVFVVLRASYAFAHV